MFGQTFEYSDLARLGALAFIEMLLSADNAVVLGLLAHALPEKLRKKALFIGLASAFFLRAAALLAISFLIRYRWLQLIGAAYLIYIAIHHFLKRRSKTILPPSAIGFWKTVLLIELFDVAFAIDSIIAGLVFIASTPSIGAAIHPKLWIVYTGGMIGLIGVRYAADLFSSLLTKFPRLESSAYLMVAWIGAKLALTASVPIPGLEPVFWAGLILLFAQGLFRRRST